MIFRLAAVGVVDTQTGEAITPDSVRWSEYLAWFAAGHIPGSMLPPAGPPVAQQRAEFTAQVNARRTLELASGVSYAGHIFDSDPVSQGNVTAAVAAVAAGIPLPANFTWRSADNVDVPLDAAGLLGLAGAMLARGNACYVHSWTLKATLASAVDPSTVDITAGWPT